jgi:hypothetical protein
VKGLLEAISPSNLFEAPSEFRPLSNRNEEERLEKDLLALATVPQKDALAKIKVLATLNTRRAHCGCGRTSENPRWLKLSAT